MPDKREISRLKRTRSVRSLRQKVRDWKRAGETVALVPTMGALHDGHLSLVRLAKKKADRVIVSIFVNPTQFAPHEDFDAYPRDIASDVSLLRALGVDLVYLPERDDMYFDDHSTTVRVAGVGDGLETDHRPTFFHGVALVVTKLFNRVQPDIAIFGEKDYQQLCVLRRLVRDLDMPIKIIGAPIARDAAGLALSSRNRYFDDDGLRTAQKLNVVMRKAQASLEAGKPIGSTCRHAKESLIKAGFSSVDYVTLADATSLRVQSGGPITSPMRLLIAAHCHGVRLIDNCAVGVPSQGLSNE